MASGFRVSPKYVGPVKLCVFDWAGKFTIPSSIKFIWKISQKSRERPEPKLCIPSTINI